MGVRIPLVVAQVRWMGTTALVTVVNRTASIIKLDVIGPDGGDRTLVVGGNDSVSMAYRASKLVVRYAEPDGATLYEGPPAT